MKAGVAVYGNNNPRAFSLLQCVPEAFIDGPVMMTTTYFICPNSVSPASTHCIGFYQALHSVFIFGTNTV